MASNLLIKNKSPPRNIPPLRAPPLRFGNSPSPDPLKHSKRTRNHKFVIGLPSHKPQQSLFQTGTDVHALQLDSFGTNESPTSFNTRSIRLSRLSRDQSKVFQSIDRLRTDLSASKDEPDDADEFKDRLRTPWIEEKIIPEDDSPQNIVGQEAVKNFYSHYKKLGRVKDVNTFMHVKNAVYTSVLGKSESLGLLPSKIGFIKEKGNADIVQLKLGDKYVEVLSEGIQSMKGFGKIELSNNRITPVGADALISKLNNFTQVLDLSGNNIGKIGAEHLCNVIGLKNSQLLEINLEGNKLGDHAVNQLCEAVAYSDSLRKLNLGKNFLSDGVTDKVTRMLELNTSLEELYLQWNQIKSPGGTTLVSGLRGASKLKVLDLSWNTLGQGGSQFSKAFGSYIATNTTLMHLDLSNNYITKPDAMVIAEDLKVNHTLYGFHFHGNVGYVDFKGFLVIPEDCSQSVAGRVLQPPINGMNYHPESLKHHMGNYGEYEDVCWICEGWRPIEFSWKPGKSGLGDRDPIYLHFSFEGHKGIFLPKKSKFTKPRMVPPNQFDYFFTVENQPVYDGSKPYRKPIQNHVKAKVENEIRDLKVDKMNYGEKYALVRIFNDEFEPSESMKKYDIKPRIVDESYIPPDVLIERPEWKIPVSIFRNFKPDTQALLDDCFRVDFENTRILKIVKSGDDQKFVRELLYNSYRSLKDCYKHYAAIGAPSDIWSIPLNTYTELCQSCKIIDNKIVKLSDFDRIFIATYTRSEKERNPRNPDRALVRYQFLEGLVRLAEHKYVSSGAAQTYYEGLKMLLDESLMPYISGFNHQQWREDKYWNEPVDTVYKSYFPVLRGVYKKYSGAKTLPGQKKFMCLEEFQKLLGDAGMYNENCGERDATLAFSLAMMTQVDELNSNRIFEMQFVEFLEALARAADKYSAHPYAYLVYNPQTGQPENEMPYEQRYAQPLEIKLEGLMPLLFSICENNVKELWAMPEGTIFDMQEVDPRVRFSTKKKKIMRINPTSPNSIEPYEGFNALQV